MTVKKMDYRVPRELARTEAVSSTRPERNTPLRATAEALTRRGVAAAKTELVNAALVAYTEMVFDTDPDGALVNLDADGRLLVPAPWARAGGRLWALRATEQRALNTIMRQRSEQSAALYVYDLQSRCWLLGRGYGGRRLALAYLRTYPVGLAEWRAAWAGTASAWRGRNLGGD